MRPRRTHPITAKVAVLKVLYLLAVTAVAFIVPTAAAIRPARWFVVSALLAIQILLLLACRIGVNEVVRPIWRLKWLFLFLIGCYFLLPPEHPEAGDTIVYWHVPLNGWLVPLNFSGLERGVLMCLQILTLVLASTLVRLTGSGNDLAAGLRAFGLPNLFVYSLDHTLELLGGAQRSGRRGDGRRDRGFHSTVKRLVRGEIGELAETINANIGRAGERARLHGDIGVHLAHDTGIVTGIALCMASVKVLKILPGLPFAPGHKVVLLFPLYVLASRLTYSRWGGTAAGSIMGVIAFLQGDGRFGVLDIFKHITPGLVIDIGEPLVRRLPSWAFGYCLLGFAAAVARISTDLLLVVLLGARAEVYLFPAAILVPNLVAGLLSGFVTTYVLRAFARSAKLKPPKADA
jgi:Cobalt transport protein